MGVSVSTKHNLLHHNTLELAARTPLPLSYRARGSLCCERASRNRVTYPPRNEEAYGPPALAASGGSSMFGTVHDAGLRKAILFGALPVNPSTPT